MELKNCIKNFPHEKSIDKSKKVIVSKDDYLLFLIFLIAPIEYNILKNTLIKVIYSYIRRYYFIIGINNSIKNKFN